MECYLDNSATTKPCKEAVEACVSAMETEYGNPSSLHGMGYRAEQTVTRAKEQLAAALSCTAAEILFTSGATESNNLALFGAAEAGIRRGRTILTTAVEHPSVLETAAELERRGFTVKRLLPGEDGRYTAEQFADAVDSDTVLVSCMMVNNETGLILPVEEIARAVKRKNAQTLVHVDGVQGFLKIPVKLKTSSIDLRSVSGHKVRAPKGIGALYVKRGVRLIPRMFGGGQQGGLRSGTEPVPVIAAFGAAVEAQKDAVSASRERYAALKGRLLTGCEKISGVSIHSGEECAPHIVSLSVYGIRSEVMLHFLEQYAIYVSSGSACAKGKQSYVLEALGIDRRESDETLRVSFGAETTEAMIDEFLLRLEEGSRSLARQR